MTEEYTPVPRDDVGRPVRKKGQGKKARPPKSGFSLDDFLADYRPLEKVVPIATRGDLIGQLQQLEQELDAARDNTSGGLSEGGEAIQIATRIEELRGQVRKSSLDFRIVSVGDRIWSNLIAANPPSEEDKAEGLPWSVDTFYPAVLAASVAEPQMTPDQADKLLEQLSTGQIRKLIGAVLEVNGGGDDIPKSDAPSVLRQASKPKRTTAARVESLDPSSLDGL